MDLCYRQQEGMVHQRDARECCCLASLGVKDKPRRAPIVKNGIMEWNLQIPTSRAYWLGRWGMLGTAILSKTQIDAAIALTAAENIRPWDALNLAAHLGPSQAKLVAGHLGKAEEVQDMWLSWHGGYADGANMLKLLGILP